MLAGLHFFVGSAVSISSTRNLINAFILGVLSHHLLDFLPHLDLNIFNRKYNLIKDWDKKVWFLVISEFSLFLILTFYFLGRFDFQVQKIGFWGGIGGIFPDVLTLFLKNFFPNLKIFDFYLNFHKKFHYQFKDKKILLPILVELLILFFSLLLFLGY